MSSLSIPWHSFVLFPHVMPLALRSRAWRLPLHPLLRELQEGSEVTSQSPPGCTARCTQPPSQDTSSSPFGAFLWMLSKTKILSVWWSCTQYSRWGCTSAKCNRKIISFIFIIWYDIFITWYLLQSHLLLISRKVFPSDAVSNSQLFVRHPDFAPSW